MLTTSHTLVKHFLETLLQNTELTQKKVLTCYYPPKISADQHATFSEVALPFRYPTQIRAKPQFEFLTLYFERSMRRFRDQIGWRDEQQRMDALRSRPKVRFERCATGLRVEPAQRYNVESHR
jgi:hypothetical protein